MSGESGAYRWWENYLVRYLMPSIAGAVIVNWLVTKGGCELRQLLLLDVGSNGLQSPTLILLFLYGNLFCYVSSYPILGFHVTRVIDFENGNWSKSVFYDGYILTLLLGVIVFVSTSSIGDSCYSRVIPFVLALIFSALQIYRIYLGMVKITFENLSGPVSKVFAYTFSLARRRGVVEETQTTKQVSKDQEDEETGDKFDEEKEWQKKSKWQTEFIDSYRHMREHGNSAFIFILEITLAGLCYGVLVANEGKSASYKLAAIGILLVIWAVPAMFIHLMGQHLERRFSWYDKRVK